MARPRLKEGAQLYRHAQCCVTPADLEQFEAAARQVGLTLSEWMRKTLNTAVKNTAPLVISQAALIAEVTRSPVRKIEKRDVLAPSFAGAVSSFNRRPMSRH